MSVKSLVYGVILDTSQYEGPLKVLQKLTDKLGETKLKGLHKALDGAGKLLGTLKQKALDAGSALLKLTGKGLSGLAGGLVDMVAGGLKALGNAIAGGAIVKELGGSLGATIGGAIGAAIGTVIPGLTATAGGGLGGAIGGLIQSVLTRSVGSALDDKKINAGLERVFTSQEHDWNRWAGAVEEAANRMRRATGIDDSEFKGVIGNLVFSGMRPEAAIGALTTIQGIAYKLKMPLTEAAELYRAIWSGQAKLAKTQLGLNVAQTGNQAKDVDVALEAATRFYAAYGVSSDPFSRMAMGVEQLFKAIGEKLEPVVMPLLRQIESIGLGFLESKSVQEWIDGLGNKIQAFLSDIPRALSPIVTAVSWLMQVPAVLKAIWTDPEMSAAMEQFFEQIAGKLGRFVSIAAAKVSQRLAKDHPILAEIFDSPGGKYAAMTDRELENERARTANRLRHLDKTGLRNPVNIVMGNKAQSDLALIDKEITSRAQQDATKPAVPMLDVLNKSFSQQVKMVDDRAKRMLQSMDVVASQAKANKTTADQAALAMTAVPTQQSAQVIEAQRKQQEKFLKDAQKRNDDEFRDMRQPRFDLTVNNPAPMDYTLSN